MRPALDGKRIVPTGLLLVAGLLLVGCNARERSSSPPGLSTTWSLPGADRQNSRAVGGPINSSTVADLGVAWTVPITPRGFYGAYATTPVVSEGVVYTQDLASNVEAIDLESGRVLWTKRYNSVNNGPNGVTIGGGTIYGATTTSAFALEATTGRQLWIRKLTRNSHEGIDMAPGYDEGSVYVSTVPLNPKSFYAGNGRAILTAMDASTGAVRWTWDEVPADLWSAEHGRINSGGGQWYPPTFDGKGSLYVGVSNPAPFTGTPGFPWGTSRPGDNLYTNSIVKLDASSGKLIWHYQLTPHDIYDWDLQNSPLLVTANGKQLVIDAGKAGIVVAVDAKTGRLVWKRRVGIHNGHDDDNLAVERGDYSNVRIPEIVEPGPFGGVESPLATDGRTVFLAVNNLPALIEGQGLKYISPAVPVSEGTGELVAIDAASGTVKWDHKLKSSPYGAATIANDVVFTTTFDGTVHGFDLNTGEEIWSTRLGGGTNAPVGVVGDTLFAARTLPASDQQALVVAYRLGATARIPDAR